jgi:hypothetical protein
MKNHILIIILTIVFATLSTNVFANSDDEAYVRVSQVYCDSFRHNGEHVECVVVELTEAGILHMKKYGYTHVVVQVVPKLFDFRSSQQITISKEKGNNRIEFNVNSETRCGEHDFNLKIVSWI